MTSRASTACSCCRGCWPGSARRRGCAAARPRRTTRRRASRRQRPRSCQRALRQRTCASPETPPMLTARCAPLCLALRAAVRRSGSAGANSARLRARRWLPARRLAPCRARASACTTSSATCWRPRGSPRRRSRTGGTHCRACSASARRRWWPAPRRPQRPARSSRRCAASWRRLARCPPRSTRRRSPRPTCSAATATAPLRRRVAPLLPSRWELTAARRAPAARTACSLSLRRLAAGARTRCRATRRPWSPT
mmetsp:Transcript_1108/g.3520  ORF Transcript_1108/g.3520 Transcript_1108/m.3520 type:complete len:253 (-) Transcript_1108:29-787(-)